MLPRTEMSDPLVNLTTRLADHLHGRRGRRSVLALLGKAALGVGGAAILESLELTAPSSRAFASHCGSLGQPHSGALCGNQTNCSSNGYAATGGSWLSCCTGNFSGTCGNCHIGWNYTQYTDCCHHLTYCGSSPEGRCPTTSKCFGCKLQRCTTTRCKGPVPCPSAP